MSCEDSRIKGKGVVCYVPLDPAARNVPMGGKYKFTYLLTAICTALLIQLLIIGGGIRSISENPLFGPSILALVDGGGLSRNLIIQGQWWRLIWAGLLHAGWLHLIMNLVVWIPLGKIIEPEWGFLRYGLCFLVSAFTGCLLSATLDGVNISVGASGGIYGVMMALNVYILEYWSTIPRAKVFMIAAVVSSIIAICGSFIPLVDAYAHLGGAVGGLLFALATQKRCDIGVGETAGKGWHHSIRPITATELTELHDTFYEDDEAAVQIDDKPTAPCLEEGTNSSQTAVAENMNPTGAATVTFAEQTTIIGDVQPRPTKPSRRMSCWQKLPGIRNYLEYQDRKYVPDGTTHFMYLIGRGSTASISKTTGRPRRVVINASARRTSIRRTRVLALRPAKFEHSWGLWCSRTIAAAMLVAIWSCLLFLLLGCADCYRPPGQLVTVRRTGRLLSAHEPRILI